LFVSQHLENLTGLTPLPHWAYVTVFVDSYFAVQSEQDLLTFASEHPEYKMEHVENLAILTVAATLKKKKERQDLLKRLRLKVEMAATTRKAQELMEASSPN